MNVALTMTDIAHVEVGDPDFPTPPHIVVAAHKTAAADEGRGLVAIALCAHEVTIKRALGPVVVQSETGRSHWERRIV